MPALIKYILLVFSGILLILFCSLLQQPDASQPGEYYYSGFLKNNYTILTAIIFLIAGLLIGYYLTLNPWYAGLCLILVFPAVSLYEGAVYKGSHNLLPFELLFHFLFAFPAILGIYTGKYILIRTPNTKA